MSGRIDTGTDHFVIPDLAEAASADIRAFLALGLGEEPVNPVAEAAVVQIG
jgi:hypothetical protein